MDRTIIHLTRKPGEPIVPVKATDKGPDDVVISTLPNLHQRTENMVKEMKGPRLISTFSTARQRSQGQRLAQGPTLPIPTRSSLNPDPPSLNEKSNLRLRKMAERNRRVIGKADDVINPLAEDEPKPVDQDTFLMRARNWLLRGS